MLYSSKILLRTIIACVSRNCLSFSKLLSVFFNDLAWKGAVSFGIVLSIASIVALLPKFNRLRLIDYRVDSIADTD